VNRLYRRVIGIITGFVALGSAVASSAAIQASNTQIIQISQSPPAQEAGPFEIFGRPLTLRKGFDVKLELDVTHAVRVEVGSRSFALSGKGGNVSGSGRIALEGGEVYPVKETYVFKASVDSVFIKGEFPVEFTIEWSVLPLDTGVYNFGITGVVRQLDVVVSGDVAGNLKADLLGTRIVLPIATVRDIPGGEKLVYQASFAGKFERTSTLDWTGQVIPEWDVSGDGVTDIVDLVRVARRFGEVGVSAREDVNGDHVINIVDLVLIALHFGERLRLPAAPAVVDSGNRSAAARLIESPLPDRRRRVDVIVDADAPLAAYDVSFDLDPRCALESVENGTRIGRGFSYRVPTQDGSARFIGVGVPVRQEAFREGTVVSLIFQVPDDVNVEPARLRSLTLADAQARLIQTRVESSSRPRKTFSVSGLRQNYPNPFNPETWIPFALSASAETTIEIFDVAGRRVRTLHLGILPAGEYLTRDRAAYWDGRNDFGEPVASGTYLVRLTSGSVDEVRRIVLAR